MTPVGKLTPGHRISLGGKTVVVGGVTGRKQRSYAMTHDVIVSGLMDGVRVEIRFRGVSQDPELETESE